MSGPFVCPLCSQHYSDASLPTTLPCGHSCCLSHTQELNLAERFCFACRSPFPQTLSVNEALRDGAMAYLAAISQTRAQRPAICCRGELPSPLFSDDSKKYEFPFNGRMEDNHYIQWLYSEFATYSVIFEESLSHYPALVQRAMPLTAQDQVFLQDPFSQQLYSVVGTVRLRVKLLNYFEGDLDFLVVRFPSKTLVDLVVGRDFAQRQQVAPADFMRSIFALAHAASSSCQPSSAAPPLPDERTLSVEFEWEAEGLRPEHSADSEGVQCGQTGAVRLPGGLVQPIEWIYVAAAPASLLSAAAFQQLQQRAPLSLSPLPGREQVASPWGQQLWRVCGGVRLAVSLGAFEGSWDFLVVSDGQGGDCDRRPWLAVGQDLAAHQQQQAAQLGGGRRNKSPRRENEAEADGRRKRLRQNEVDYSLGPEDDEAESPLKRRTFGVDFG